jgi:hypothetical protein
VKIMGRRLCNSGVVVVIKYMGSRLHSIRVSLIVITLFVVPRLVTWIVILCGWVYLYLGG